MDEPKNDKQPTADALGVSISTRGGKTSRVTILRRGIALHRAWCEATGCDRLPTTLEHLSLLVASDGVVTPSGELRGKTTALALYHLCGGTLPYLGERETANVMMVASMIADVVTDLDG
jgi:hypothetical protein